MKYNMKLFEYVIVYNPSDEKLQSEIIQTTTMVLAKDESTAKMEAVLKIPESYRSNLENIDIYIRPF